MSYLYSLLIIILLLPTLTLAQYVPLVGIPGVTDPNNDFSGYINALYAISIAVAGLLAVVKLVIAGVKYMMTDIVTTKGDAKKDIQGALLGLLVVLAAVLILTIINQDITEADIQVTPAREVPAPPPPISQTTEFEEACTQMGGGEELNCTAIPCQTFDSVGMGNYIGVIGTTLGYAIQILGIDYGLNAATCEVRCDFIGGSRINTSFGNSGNCVYPNDLETARINIHNALAAEYGCNPEDFVTSGSGVHRCFGLSDAEVAEILQSLNIIIDESLIDSILLRIKNSGYKNLLVNDSNERASYVEAVGSGATEVSLLVAVTYAPGTQQYQEVDNFVSGICESIRGGVNPEFGVVGLTLNQQNYIGCVR